MKKKITSTEPPTAEKGRWELGLDPWHVDAAPPATSDSPIWKRGPRRLGWFEIDWCGNPIGWIAEGDEFEIAEPK